MQRHRVLIVDDSALVREVLSQVLSRADDLDVVGTAADPFKAWEKIKALRPDVLTLDVEMPRMDGLTFLERLMRLYPMPVVMVSKLTQNNCEVTIRALELGAIDFMTKPDLDIRRGTLALGDELIEKVRAAAGTRPQRESAGHSVASTTPPVTARPDPRRAVQGTRTAVPPRIIAIGASTGGVAALFEILTAMPPDSPGMVVVQHMPGGFTRSFAERLHGACELEVLEAQNGDAIQPGRVLIAPGGSQMEVREGAGSLVVQVFAGAPVNHHRPSVDLIFESCAEAAGCDAIAALLTGMGRDGAQGLQAMHHAGAHTIAQDEDTCVVFGMPREAIALGAADEILPLNGIAQAMERRFRALSRGH